LKLIPKRILEKPNSEWSLDEILIYESHPLKAVEQLRVMKDMTNDILMMVAQHHENAIGTGFPNRIRDVSTSPLAKILIVAAFFSDLLRMQTNANQNMTAVMAIDYIEKTLSQPFNKQVFSSLKKIVGF
jgi:HD-GYP domain-containing protein (c-di-GMP phosphodiesterase class II)